MKYSYDVGNIDYRKDYKSSKKYNSKEVLLDNRGFDLIYIALISLGWDRQVKNIN